LFFLSITFGVEVKDICLYFKYVYFFYLNNTREKVATSFRPTDKYYL
jgi:hypothetical protein